eukprot:1190889-Prorocentrum_minimum.AAC.2
MQREAPNLRCLRDRKCATLGPAVMECGAAAAQVHNPRAGGARGAGRGAVPRCHLGVLPQGPGRGQRQQHAGAAGARRVLVRLFVRPPARQRVLRGGGPHSKPHLSPRGGLTLRAAARGGGGLRRGGALPHAAAHGVPRRRQQPRHTPGEYS